MNELNRNQLLAPAFLGAIALGAIGCGNSRDVSARDRASAATFTFDAVRIAPLFALGEIPFTIPGENKLVTQGAAHLGKWVLFLSVAWTFSLLYWCPRQVEKKEV